MIAGNIGSEAIMSYTVIGDAVNLGVRLESLNKEYGTRIIISDATRRRLAGRYIFPPAGRRRGEGQDPAGGDFRGRRPRHEKPVGTPETPPFQRSERGAYERRSGSSLHCSPPARRRTRSSAASSAKRARRHGAEAEVRRTQRSPKTKSARSATDVSAKIRERFGVVQDPAVHKYVTLVGTTLAQASDRPEAAWTFIVLDTDGVNAFASPGGFVHITRGALGLIKSEAELAGVLATRSATSRESTRSTPSGRARPYRWAPSETLSDRAPLLDQLANRAYEMVLENSFDRGDELDADKVSVDLTQKVGYASGSLGDFLARLDDRNKDQPEKNGLFASHPETKERIAKIKQMAAAKNGALVEVRYKSNVKYEPTPITSIAAVPDGASGLTGSTKSAEHAPKKDESKDAPKEEPKKKGFGIGSLKQTVAPEKESAQVSASGGARGVGPDRAAKGGGNPAIVKTNVTVGELATFKQSIA